MRGFSGVRAEILPRGRMNLPSAAFREAALAAIPQELPEDERRRRLTYVEEVESRLREIQARAVADHFRKAAWGQAADAATGILFLVLAAGLIMRVGPFEPVTLLLIGLFGLKLAFMHWSVRRLLNVAKVAFQADSSRIDLPWQPRPRAGKDSGGGDGRRPVRRRAVPPRVPA